MALPAGLAKKDSVGILVLGVGTGGPGRCGRVTTGVWRGNLPRDDVSAILAVANRGLVGDRSPGPLTLIPKT